jgi:hypothetical protein
MAVYTSPQICRTCKSFWQPDLAQKGECRFNPPIQIGRNNNANWLDVGDEEWCRQWEGHAVTTDIDDWLAAHPSYTRLTA